MKSGNSEGLAWIIAALIAVATGPIGWIVLVLVLIPALFVLFIQELFNEE